LIKKRGRSGGEIAPIFDGGGEKQGHIVGDNGKEVGLDGLFSDSFRPLSFFGRDKGTPELMVLDIETNPLYEGSPALDFGNGLVEDGAIEQGGKAFGLNKELLSAGVIGWGQHIEEGGITEEGGRFVGKAANGIFDEEWNIGDNEEIAVMGEREGRIIVEVDSKNLMSVKGGGDDAFDIGVKGQGIRVEDVMLERNDGGEVMVIPADIVHADVEREGIGKEVEAKDKFHLNGGFVERLGEGQVSGHARGIACGESVFCAGVVDDCRDIGMKGLEGGDTDEGESEKVMPYTKRKRSKGGVEQKED